MPRVARIKSENAIYHIMIRSISEVDLFKDDDDKSVYLDMMKTYQTIYKFQVYAYCLMDNHAHFIIDSLGSDISKVMHCINFKYAQYFNRKHKRHGHLFQDRFKSKIINSERYFFTVSAYIHNNAMSKEKYIKRPQDYRFSSLYIYLYKKPDYFGLIPKNFIKSFMGKGIRFIGKNYLKYVIKCDDLKVKEETEFENEGTFYKSGRKIISRRFKPEDVLEFVAKRLNISKSKLFMKHSRNVIDGRALSVIIMRSLCNMKCIEICDILGNITQSRISKLSNLGVDLINKNKNYDGIIEEFISICKY